MTMYNKSILVALLGVLALAQALVVVPRAAGGQSSSSSLSRRSSTHVLRAAASTAFKTSNINNNNNNASSLRGLKVAVVGAGPSGLLLAHLLLNAGCASCHVYEGRNKPADSVAGDPRAYALGLGRRGRTAIQAVDVELWQLIKAQGFASERFHLHVGSLLRVRLRDAAAGVEPSLLLFQTDLCRVLAQELEDRWNSSGKLKVEFDCKVTSVDLEKKLLTTGSSSSDKFDLVVGCDGVNSIVRQTMQTTWPEFNVTKELIPGLFKVVRLASMPPKLDPTAVALVLPKSGAATAFVEPTVNGSCCILFAGKNATDPLLSSGDAAVVEREIQERFPLLQGADIKEAAMQIANRKDVTQASLVKCNTFNYGGTAVLVGDAAHATGGVSGQGVNSALMDSVALAESLSSLYDPAAKEESLRKALLAYSQKQVPEGRALYDLSFGPNPESLPKRLMVGIKAVRDTLFKGRLGIGEMPLRTLLTTSLESFASLRRKRDSLYDGPFPDEAEWKQTLSKLDATVTKSEQAA